MRGLKVRSADTLDNWSSALKDNVVVGGIREYIDTQDLLRAPLTGATFTGPVILSGNAVNPLEAAPLQQVDGLITTAIANLVGAAPTLLDTIQELSAALLDNPNAITELTTLVSQKASLEGATFTGLVYGIPNTSTPTAFVTLGDVQNLIGAILGAVEYVFSANFTTTGSSTIDVELSATGVTAGTYPKVVVDIYGRVTSGELLLDTDLPLVAPTAGDVFNGSTISITDALAALQAAITSASGNADGFEDSWVGDGSVRTFTFNNINGTEATIKTNRLLVFVDGIRQPKDNYSVSATGIYFNVAPFAGTEVEALQIS
jgi:phage-related tail fiber protein